MSKCYNPMKAHRDADGNIKFTDRESQSELKLPCGQCLGCRLNHAEGWALRMVHEAQQHAHNSFITLTYDENNIPPGGTLRYSDVTLFIKKLRKVLKKANVSIKYYRVGEYGEKFSRPHYHIILFGFDFTTRLRYRGEENERTLWRTKNGNKYYTSNLLTKLWGLGHAEIGEVNYNTCMYVAKYVTKKVNGQRKQEHYQRLDPQTGELNQVEQEKASMSRRQAIGKQWLENFWSDVYPEDNVVHEAKRLKTPRYYDKWLEKNNPTLYEQVKQKREENTLSDDQSDLTRIYHTKMLTAKNFVREYELTETTNIIDKKILQYRINEAIELHETRKKKC